MQTCIGFAPEALDQIGNAAIGFQRSAVHDQAGGNVEDRLGFDQAVFLERASGRDEIDDPPRQPERRGKLHRAIELHAFGLDAERLEMAAESAKWAEEKTKGLTGAWDHDKRIEVLDADGIAAEILFVDGLTKQNSPPFGGDF